MSAFIDGLPKLPDPQVMKIWDQTAIEFGLPEELLMENAGNAVMEVIASLYPDIRQRNIWIFMGSGNNGGDAACIARKLMDKGALPVVFHTAPLTKIKGAAAKHVMLAQKDKVPFIPLIEQEQPEARGLLEILFHNSASAPLFILDGLLGTGFSGQLKSGVDALVQAINKISAFYEIPVLAIDIPSGLNGTTGKPQPHAIKARHTVTLACAKPGLVLSCAKEWTGEVFVQPIGFPAAIESELPASLRLLDGYAMLDACNLVSNSYKNVYGHVLVIGGSQGHEGAAHLACVAALRSGAGLVTACAQDASAPIIKADWSEIMTMNVGRIWPETLARELEEGITQADALVIGPGFGTDANSLDFFKAVLQLKDRPRAVIDADALTLLARDKALFAHIGEEDILTPHPGEAGRLLGISPKEVQNNRQSALEQLLALAPCVFILKGANTLLGQQGEPFLLCPFDIPQMAIGGAGDVLAGCAGAFLADRSARTEANTLAVAAKAVITHVMAGLMLGQRFSNRGMLASELADALARSRQFAQDEQKRNFRIAPWPSLK